MTERWVWTCTTDSSSVILLKVCHKGGEGSQGFNVESSANCVVYFASNRQCKVKYAVQDFSPLARCLNIVTLPPTHHHISHYHPHIIAF